MNTTKSFLGLYSFISGYLENFWLSKSNLGYKWLYWVISFNLVNLWQFSCSFTCYLKLFHPSFSFLRLSLAFLVFLWLSMTTFGNLLVFWRDWIIRAICRGDCTTKNLFFSCNIIYEYRFCSKYIYIIKVNMPHYNIM